MKIPVARRLVIGGELRRNGFARVRRFLAPKTIDQLREVTSDVDDPADGGFFVSVAHGWGDLAATLDLQIRRTVSEPLKQLLPGRRNFLAAVTSKAQGAESVVKYHQDWTYTDERLYRTTFVWCPLVDCDESSGALSFVPGSHRWTSGIRPSRSSEVTELFQDEFAHASVAVPARAGDAVVFDPATVHGSLANLSIGVRPAVTLALVDVDAQLLHFHLDDSGRLDGFAVAEQFFTRNPYGSRPLGCPQVEPWSTAVTPSDFAAGLRCSTRPVRR